MIGSAFYGALCLLTVVLQATLIASWPDPLKFFPLTLIAGVIILHERSVLFGTVWISLSAAYLEWHGLGDGYFIAGLVASLTGAGLVLLVFSKRSVWALLGVAVSCATAFVLARVMWLTTLAAITERPAASASELASFSVWTIFLTGFGVFIFGVYIRRFLRWSKAKFMSRGRLYEVSLPY